MWIAIVPLGLAIGLGGCRSLAAYGAARPDTSGSPDAPRDARSKRRSVELHDVRGFAFP